MEYVPVILAVAVLCASLAPSVHPLPLSGTGSATRPESHTATDKRSGSVERLPRNTEDQEDSGAAHDSTTDSGEESAATTQNSTTSCGVGTAAVVDDPIQRCLEECYYSQVTREDIRSLHEAVWPRSIHPGFALGLWLETYHQIEYCKDHQYQSCNDNGQTMNNIRITITNGTQQFLGHTVLFNETHYPRYFVSGYNTSNSTLKYLVQNEISGWQPTDGFYIPDTN